MTLQTIYTAVGGLTPQYDTDVTINIRDHTKIREEFSSFEAPCRMLLLPDDKVEGGIGFIALGKTMQGTYQVLDRLYLSAVSEDWGINHAHPRFAKYVDSYREQVRQNRSLGLTQAHIVGVQFSNPYVKNWPDEGVGDPYFVIDCVLTVQEFYSGA